MHHGAESCSRFRGARYTPTCRSAIAVGLLQEERAVRRADGTLPSWGPMHGCIALRALWFEQTGRQTKSAGSEAVADTWRK
jgi:hypothetical protein